MVQFSLVSQRPALVLAASLVTRKKICIFCAEADKLDDVCPSAISLSLCLWLSSSFHIYLYGANRNDYMIATTFTTHFVAIYAVHTFVHFYHLGGISSTHTTCVSSATLS